MINPFAEIDWHPSPAKRRQFGKVLALVFAAIGALALFAHASNVVLIILGAGTVAGFLCWLFPAIALPLYLVWHAFGASIGIVVSNLLLAATYYAVLTPIAVALRLAGRDPLSRRFEPRRSSYWEPAESVVDPARYFRQF